MRLTLCTLAASTICLTLALTTGSSASVANDGSSTPSVKLPSADWTPLTGTAARTASTFEDAKGVVHYKFDPSRLPGHVLAKDRGDKSAGGCAFEGAGGGQAAGEQTLTRVTEVKFDPASCTRVLAVATYPLSDLPAAVEKSLEQSELAKGSSTDGQKSTATQDLAVAAAAASYSGYLKANVEDPPGLNVSSTRSTIHWTATSSCVTSSTRDPYWSWLSASGWSRTSGTILANINACTRAYLNIAGTFKNNAFCPGSGNTTYTNHSKTVFEGLPNGEYSWAYTMDKSGGCSSLLHYDYDLSHP